MKCVKTARCLFLSMNAIWLSSAWTLDIKRKPFNFNFTATDKICGFHSSHGKKHTVSPMSAYTVWYVWQLKFLVLRQNRKLEDEEARNGRILAWNTLRTKVSSCTSASVKLANVTSANASRAFERESLLVLGA